MKLVLIRYNAGNVRSVTNALNRLGIEPIITDNPTEIKSADKVIFPGVGEASTAMNFLKEKGLDQLIPQLKQPVLGVCLGLQLMCTHSEENDTKCLGIFNVAVRRFTPTLKVPQMGWNSISNLASPLFDGLKEGAYVYFVHSYRADLSPWTIAQTQYSDLFSAALHKDNFYAVQFHPEKSSEAGSIILKNFIEKI